MPIPKKNLEELNSMNVVYIIQYLKEQYDKKELMELIYEWS